MTTISNTIEKDDIVVSGARCTGAVHIGNYFGAIRHFVNLSNTIENPMYFFLADWHSLTTHSNAEKLKSNVLDTLAIYIGCGLNPEKANIYIQSDVPYIAELYLYLNMMAKVGELERTATFKEKVQKNPDNVNAGLLTYPVLMAADVLIHKGTKVPVGKDQAQHVEMIRTFGNRFNHTYQSEFFKEASVYNFQSELLSIPSLSGSGKMSKSDDENSAIMLTDSPQDILRKMKRAKTDSGPTVKNSPLSPEIKNLFQIMKLFSSPQTLSQFEEDYANCSIRYGDLKMKIAEDATAYLAPIREKILDLRTHPDYLYQIADQGAKNANLSAKQTIEEMREIIGLRFGK